MKLYHLFFVTLLTIFVIQVRANYNYEDYKQWEYKIPDSCEELFKTNYCSECQKLMWKHFQYPGECATAFNFGQEVYKAIKNSGETPKPYDLTYFKEALYSYCHKDFRCRQ